MQTVFFSKTLKAYRKCADIFEAPVKILEMQVFFPGMNDNQMQRFFL